MTLSSLVCKIIGHDLRRIYLGRRNFKESRDSSAVKCEQRFSCKRCYEVVIIPVETPHNFTNWHHDRFKCNSGSSEIPHRTISVEERYCDSCGLLESREIDVTSKNPSEWITNNEEKCVSSQRCVSCHKLTESVEIGEHDFGEYSYSFNRTYPELCYWERTCLRCGKKQISSHEHEFGEKRILQKWKRTKAGEGFCISEGSNCVKCGYLETVKNHSYIKVNGPLKEEHHKLGGGDDYVNFWSEYFECEYCGDVYEERVSDY